MGVLIPCGQGFSGLDDPPGFLHVEARTLDEIGEVRLVECKIAESAWGVVHIGLIGKFTLLEFYEQLLEDLQPGRVVRVSEHAGDGYRRFEDIGGSGGQGGPDHAV